MANVQSLFAKGVTNTTLISSLCYLIWPIGMISFFGAMRDLLDLELIYLLKLSSFFKLRLNSCQNCCICVVDWVNFISWIMELTDIWRFCAICYLYSQRKMLISWMIVIYITLLNQIVNFYVLILCKICCTLHLALH